MAMNPSYGTSPFATPDGSQAGTDFLNYRASQTPWFQMGANGQPQWNMPTANNLGMGATPPTAGASAYPGMGSFDAGASNPNLTSQADDIQRRVQQMMGQTMAGIQGNAVGVGGLGGARQGVAQGIAASQGMDNLAGQLSNLYGGAWENQQNRGLQKYGMNLTNQLGNRQVDLGRYTADQGFYLGNRAQDQNQFDLGLKAWGLGNAGAWGPLQGANSIYGAYLPNDGTNNVSNTTGGGWQSALGGALGAGKYGWDRGWWGNTPTGK